MGSPVTGPCRDRATAADLARRSDGTRWTNEQLLFHMVFGYMIVLRLLVLVRLIDRLPMPVGRALALTPDQVESPLAAPPYDLRHAGVSLWLNAGVHAPEVAERAGHGVDVMLRVYAKCIDGQRDVANQRIAEALAS
ncbi:hypothetical protein [Spirillospora sp. NPDC029432]|uniref:hypothetical protein n=1 Tax=Spirillospora sp. NPDC029432 TaxID=3154599 RepID=UPI003456C1B0